MTRITLWDWLTARRGSAGDTTWREAALNNAIRREHREDRMLAERIKKAQERAERYQRTGVQP